MEQDRDPGGPDCFGWLLHQAGVPPAKLTALAPDFLVISPPKTGSTWLAENLGRHPRVFVPAVKEVKYFSCLFESLGLGWYLDQFAPGAGKLKGEATPSYSLLPTGRIRMVRRLFPGLRLVYLMREPVARAWSHARHTFRFREASFTGFDGPFEAVPEALWQEAIAHDWTLASGDYLGQLRRWLSVFPRGQVYVGFYESIAREPEALLRSVLAFLGAGAGADLSGFPLRERVMPGLPGGMSDGTARFARRLLARRSRELAAYLRGELGLDLPPEWGELLGGPGEGGDGPEAPLPEAFRRAGEDEYLSAVLAQEGQFPLARRVVDADYRGSELAWDRGLLLACPLGQPGEEGPFAALSLGDLKERVDRHAFAEAARARAAAGEAEARLALRVDEAVAELRRLQAEVARLGEGYSPALRRLRLAWRRLRDFLSGASRRGGAGGSAAP